jgi:hypothetical protein
LGKGGASLEKLEKVGFNTIEAFRWKSETKFCLFLAINK